LHIWASRVDALELPDWCILDLDPKSAPFEHVVEVARALHRLCEEMELPHFVKTSGSTGLHVLIPLAQQCTFDQSRTLGELLSRVVVAELPEISTIIRPIKGREGKVYLDYLQNRHGQLIVAPFSVRPLPGAPVSMPLEWREVNKKLDISQHTIVTARKRMKKVKQDPVRPVLEVRPDLSAVLERLMGKVSG
jgi:bifunctional non-homologous end joining protein LigD